MPVVTAELANGVRVICEPIADVRSVALGLWVGVGSRDETAELAGSAHFVEHLVFKGTERRSARAIAEFADAAGGNLNAYTTREYTCYYDKVLDEQFAEALDVLTDMVCRPRLAADDFAKERQVILDELRLVEDTPEDMVQDLFFGSLWAGHALGRPVAGRVPAIRQLTPEALRAFHARHYVGRRMVLAVAGRIDPEGVLREAERCLGGLPAGDPGERSLRRRPPRVHAVRRLRPKRIEQVQICVGSGAPGLNAPGYWATLLVANLLGGGTSSRLFQSIREDRGLVYDVGAFHAACSDCGSFAVYLAAGPDAVGEAVDLAVAEVARLRAQGVGADELGRQKEQFRRGFWLGLEGTSHRMSRLGRALILGQPVEAPEAVLAHLEDLDLGRLDAAAAALGDPADWTVAAVGPGAALRSLWPGGRRPGRGSRAGDDQAEASAAGAPEAGGSRGGADGGAGGGAGPAGGAGGFAAGPAGSGAPAAAADAAGMEGGGTRHGPGAGAAHAAGNGGEPVADPGSGPAGAHGAGDDAGAA